MAASKDDVHRLVDALPDDLVNAVARYLEALLKAVDDPAFRDMAGMKPVEKPPE